MNNHWHIYYDPKPIPCRQFDWSFHHDDIDYDNQLCGTAASYADAVEKIKEIEAELADG